MCFEVEDPEYHLIYVETCRLKKYTIYIFSYKYSCVLNVTALFLSHTSALKYKHRTVNIL